MVNGGRVAAFLPEPCLGAAAQRAYARPARVVGDERRIAAEIRVALRVAQQVPFDQLLRHRISDGLFDGDRVGRLDLAHQIDRILDSRGVARQRRRLRSVDGLYMRLRLTPRRMPRMLVFLMRSIAMMRRLVRRPTVRCVSEPNARRRRKLCKF